jgi:hypothetical protein
MKLFLKIAGYGLIICALVHTSTHFISTAPTNADEQKMFDLMTSVTSADPLMMHRSTMDFFHLFSWSFSLVSFVLGLNTVLFLALEMPPRTRKVLILANFIFFTLLMVLNVRYGIVIPLAMYGFCWFMYVIGLIRSREEA